jgi:beta-lactamase superfamily II metal-dependent hydrolase
VARSRKGCGCAIAALALFAGGIFAVYQYLYKPWDEKRKLPPPSGKELQVHMLDVGQGDSILIISPEGKTVLIDAGDTGRGKIVLEAMARYEIKQLDYLIATHAHADHIGGADEVLNGIKVLNVIDSGVVPPSHSANTNGNANANGNKNTKVKPSGKSTELPTTKAYLDFLESVKKNGSQYTKAAPGTKYDLGGGALMTVLAPIEPFFTKEQLRSGGNEPNANSVVVRIDYGEFSMLLTGDAEAQTEERMMSKGATLEAKILKVGHHGSKYATSQSFLTIVKPEVAIISDAENNKYGHPSQGALDRLKAAGVKIYRTDLNGEITILTTGKIKEGKLYEVKASKEAKSDVWAGRDPQKDDSSRAGFIAYGDYGPPPRQRKEKPVKATSWGAGK